MEARRLSNDQASSSQRSLMKLPAFPTATLCRASVVAPVHHLLPRQVVQPHSGDSPGIAPWRTRCDKTITGLRRFGDLRQRATTGQRR